jgi:hypothetical protein
MVNVDEHRAASVAAGVGSIGPVKVYSLFRRRPGLTMRQFSDHMRHPHGTWGHRIEQISPYVHGHRVESDAFDADHGSFDAVAELWFENATDCQAMAASNWNVDFLLEDCTTFIDGDGQLGEFVRDEVLDSGLSGYDRGRPDTLWRWNQRPFIIKLHIFVVPQGSADWAQESDLRLGHRVGALRHVRSWPAWEMYDVPSPHLGAIVDSRDPGIVGVRELSWPTLSAFEKGVSEDPEALEELLGRAGPGGFAVLVQAERFR